MRVIHFLENYARVGGAEAYAGQAIGYLERAGHENVVVYATAHPPELQYEARRGYHVPQPTYPDSADDAKDRIRQIIATERPDVAFVHHVYHPSIVDFVVRSLPAIAYVQGPYLFCPGHRQYLPRTERICPHIAGPICLWDGLAQGCIWGRNPRTHWRFLRRTQEFLAIYARLYRVIVGSAFMREMLVRNGLPADKIVVSPTFLLESGPTQALAATESEPPTILFSGRIVREKGLHHLLAALHEIALPWRLAVAGAGPDEQYCRELAERYGIADRVTFHGWVGPEEAEAQLDACALVAVPSLWPEPFGRVGPEAFLRGKPVVAYASGGIPDWLHDGVNGLLVPSGNVVALSRASVRLLSDVDLRRRLGRLAFEGTIVDYPIDTHMSAIIATLDDAIREWKRVEP
jgi:glycosyltransferase involved in cell wall biosynthesis